AGSIPPAAPRPPRAATSAGSPENLPGAEVRYVFPFISGVVGLNTPLCSPRAGGYEGDWDGALCRGGRHRAPGFLLERPFRPRALGRRPRPPDRSQRGDWGADGVSLFPLWRRDRFDGEEGSRAAGGGRKMQDAWSKENTLYPCRYVFPFRAREGGAVCCAKAGGTGLPGAQPHRCEPVPDVGWRCGIHSPAHAGEFLQLRGPRNGGSSDPGEEQRLPGGRFLPHRTNTHSLHHFLLCLQVCAGRILHLAAPRAHHAEEKCLCHPVHPGPDRHRHGAGEHQGQSVHDGFSRSRSRSRHHPRGSHAGAGAFLPVVAAARVPALGSVPE
ncbi:hydroxysteroid (11-beta) dehydrogenase 1-like, partial [Columba livia]